MTRQAVTKHLHALERAGLVRSQRSGRESLYGSSRRVRRQRAYLDRIARQWDDALARLKAFVET